MSRRLLIVDDDANMVQTMCDIVELHGWEASGVTNGRAAVAAVEREPFDAVLMDVRMPDLNGVEAFRAMRRHRPAIRVCLMTAYAPHDLLREAQREGVLQVLPKPFDVAEVMDLLQEVAGRVLVVDDDPEYLATLGDVLEREGFRVVRAGTVAGAIDGLQGRPPSVVILDLVLEGAEPQAAVAAIRRASPGVPFVLYSGHPAVLDETAAAVPAEWVGACLQKPLDVNQLLRVLHDLGA